MDLCPSCEDPENLCCDFCIHFNRDHCALTGEDTTASDGPCDQYRCFRLGSKEEIMDELRECPFCNGMLGITRDHSESGAPWRVVCDDCGADGPYGDTKEEAVERWNRRPEEDRLRAELADEKSLYESLAETHRVLKEDFWEREEKLRARVERLEEALAAMVGLYDDDDWYNDKAAGKAKAALEGGSPNG